MPAIRNTQADRYGQADQYGRATIHVLAQSLPLLLILVLATTLRFYHLSGQSLWADEGNSVALARRGFVEIARCTAFDIHPPLYYWLLKIWITIFGDSEIGLRSLSVVLGVGVVYLIWLLGIRLFSRRVGLIAAFIAALSPLQVYYSQEARMYMLLTFLSSLTVLTALFVLENCTSKDDDEIRKPTAAVGPKYALRLKLPGLLYLLTVTAGLYTHYAYPLILLTVNLIALIGFWPLKSQTCPEPRLEPCPERSRRESRRIINWFILQIIPLLLYLPWLPTAWRQVTTWPSEKQAVSSYEVLKEISTTLLFGLSWPLELGLIPTIALGLILLIIPWLTCSIYRLNTHHAPRPTPYVSHPLYLALTLFYLWLLLPVALTAIVFSPAFLKFLLVATPPLALLLALFIDGPVRLPQLWGRQEIKSWPGYLIGGALLLTMGITSLISLYHYYTSPAYARDNYRGIVNFIKAVSGPGDVVILNAEGQQDVFNYYYERNPISSTPVYPLPRQRPLDEATTLNELQNIADDADKIYAVYWATHQADPNGLIESWLNTHLFKATDWWYGNVRLVSYASPQTSLRNNMIPVDYQLGRHIRLTGYALASTQLTPGDILQLVLEWETDTPLTSKNYTVFVQVLDRANHLVGQRDARPLTSTLHWPVGESVIDAHGIFIEPGTPPGKHRLILGLYNSETGQRLPVIARDESNEDQTRDFIELTEVEIISRATPLPLEAFNIQMPLNTPMLEVTLLGYDLYKLGHRSTPDTPLHPNDPVHLVAYWRAHQPIQRLEDRLSIQVITNRGEATPLFFTYPPAGIDYALKEWPQGTIIRAQYDFFLNDLKPGIYHLRLTLDTGQPSIQPTAITKPFRVE